MSVLSTGELPRSLFYPQNPIPFFRSKLFPRLFLGIAIPKLLYEILGNLFLIEFFVSTACDVMASIKQSSVFNFPQNNGLGFRIPQSSLQFNWRNDPTILPCREHVLGLIQAHLKQNASGEFTREIAGLAASLENQLFMDALSEDDYLDAKTFHDRLRVKIHQKWFQARSAHQESMQSTTSLPMYNDVRMFGMPSDIGTNLNKPLADYIMTADTDSNLVSADTLNRSHLLADVMRNASSGSRKRTSDPLQHSEPVIPNNFSPRSGFSCGEPVESGPTFSGSVLQYDSEASFESHRVTQCFAENELKMMISSSQSSPSVHTTSMAGVNFKSEVLTASDEVYVQQPGFEPPWDKQQQSQQKSQLDEYYLRKNDSSDEVSVPKENSFQSHDTSSGATLLSGYEGPFQHSTSSNQWQGSATMLLCCYISYDRHSLLRGETKIPFLEYLHSQKCDGGMCNCEEFKKLLSHFDKCGSADCDICGPAIRTCAGLTCRNLSKGDQRMMGAGDCRNRSEDLMSPAKCRKLNSFSPRHGLSSGVSVLTEDSSQAPVLVNCDACTPEISMEMVNTNACHFTSIGESGNIDDHGLQESYSDKAPNSGEDLSGDSKVEIESATTCELKDKLADSCCILLSDSAPNLCDQKGIAQNEEVLTGGHSGDVKPEINGGGGGFQTTVDKSEKQKVEGITLTDFFTVDEIRVHISSLREKVDQSLAAEVAGNVTSCFVGENYCQICAVDRLAFPPMPIYCSSCATRIKNYGTYYSSKDENRAQICFCTTCYNKARGGHITICGLSIPKINLVMKKNNLVTEESWVQCDKCEGWQHQICALFNDKRDLGGKAEYVCPKCYLKDLEAEIRKPLPRSTAFDAHTLPRTLLGDHIEQRLFCRLKQEREDRSRAAGKSIEEVPEPANLVVRVVSAVDKILKVKQQFLDIFPENNYPSEFPYRSKVILLFQKIEGVDVCLFAMYVQEFGSKCSPPNQRCIYISYLDSVKYFRPEIKAVSGEALRTYVYHEILVGYLDYCKKRGFATCYIWACPPVKGEDYILYCHPETQKTPKPDKLRQWYQLMLKKASKENIVVNFSNLYEKFFVPTGECNTKVTAARLPYFEGDYWSSVAENMIKKIEEEDQQMKVKKIRRRSLKAMGHVNPSADDVKDILLMMELGQRISSAKEDFIIVYLQFVCTHCHEVILSGKRWFCSQCKNYQLCQRCHDADLEQGDTHISSSGQKHALAQETVNDVPVDTEDNDDIMDNCFLENRHAFLSFCQGNHYQFDSLRRAKHSSMMILYHLHNPNGSNVGIFCSLCLKDIGADPRWKCDICPEFSVCDSCYQRNNCSCHSHTLSLHLPAASSVADNKMARMVKELLDVVLHASQCQTIRPQCSYPNCILIRRLFSHAHACKIRVAGGCLYCKKTWLVLMMHARKCKDSNCGVPRCMDLKKYAERLELQSKTQQNMVIVAQTK